MNPYDGGTWREFEAEHFTPEERAAMAVRVRTICERIQAKGTGEVVRRESTHRVQRRYNGRRQEITACI